MANLDILDDLNIFSGGNDGLGSSKKVHIPDVDAVESSMRVSFGNGGSGNGGADSGESKGMSGVTGGDNGGGGGSGSSGGGGSGGGGFFGKMSNMLGFDPINDSSAKLKVDMDQIRANTPRVDGGHKSDYLPFNSATVRMHGDSSDSNKSGGAASGNSRASRYLNSKRYYHDKIVYFVGRLNELKPTKTTTEITINDSLEDLRDEFEMLKEEYSMVSTISSYKNVVIGGAKKLEWASSMMDDFPLELDSLGTSMEQGMNGCEEQFEELYEKYGTIKVNPLLVIGATVVKTIAEAHFTNIYMKNFGPMMGNDPELEGIIKNYASKKADGVYDAVSSGKMPPMPPMSGTNMGSTNVKATNREAEFKSHFHFADNIINENKDGTRGPPPPIHTKNTKPPASEETAEQLKQMAVPSLSMVSQQQQQPPQHQQHQQQPQRAPMKGPSSVPDVSEFIQSIQAPPAPVITSHQPPPSSSSNGMIPPGKKSRGRKPNPSVSIDI